MKKIILAAALLATTAANASPFNGFYLGVGAGYGSRSVEYKNNIADGKVNGVPFTVNAFAQSKKKSGFVYGIYGGYGMNFSGTGYAGLELSILGSNLNKIQNHQVPGNVAGVAGTVSVDAKYNRGVVFGLAPRLGMTFAKDWLAYIKLGLEVSRDKFEARAKSVTSGGTTIPYTTGNYSSKTKTKAVFVPGLGLEKAFGHVIARVQYDYNFGAKSSQDDLGLKYKEHRLTAGVAYKF